MSDWTEDEKKQVLGMDGPDSNNIELMMFNLGFMNNLPNKLDLSSLIDVSDP